LGNGQFAEWYKEVIPQQGHEYKIAIGVDIRKLEAVKSAISEYGPEAVINTAAKTNLDWCEQNRLECFDTNTLGADTVGQACQETNTYLLHISTGCIQKSTTATDAHKEDDPPTPTSFYSWSKYWADQLLQNRTSRFGLKVLILRPRQPVSARASKRNALVKMLTFSKFIDTPNSVTVLEDFIPLSIQLLEKQVTGLFNVSNPGVTSPLEMARLLKEYVKPEMSFVKIEKAELNSMTLAERIDSVLDCSKLTSLGYNLPNIIDRLKEILPTLKADLEEHPEIFLATAEETKQKLSLRNT
jgi:dTDP-4-dehydrorhamnose reductase